MGGWRVQRSAWEDRFSQPTDQEVLSHYTRQFRGCAEGIRSVMQALPGMSESLEWMGLPWRWTFVYRRQGASDRLHGYMVPLPTGPRWVLSVSQDVVEHLSFKSMPRPVREAFTSATRVGSQLWPQWDVQTKAQVLEVAGVLESVDIEQAVGT